MGERAGLLLHEEDLDAASVLADHPGLVPTLRATAVAAAPDDRSPAGASELVRAFTAGAVADAAAVLDWARTERLDTVVMPVAPVGPVWERLAVLRGVLDEGGIELVTVRRRWDSRAWPFASRGFFPFRGRIPALVRER